MKKKAYVIMRTSWEYNDEVYHSTEDDAGHPLKVFLNKKKAEDFAIEETIKAWTHEDAFSGKFYNLEDILQNMNVDEFIGLIQEVGGSCDAEDTDVKLPKDLSVENAKRILAVIRLRWYQVEEIDIEG